MLASKPASSSMNDSGRSRPRGRARQLVGLRVAALLLAASVTAACGHSTSEGGEAPATTATAAAAPLTTDGAEAAATASASGAATATAAGSESPATETPSAASASGAASVSPSPDASATAEAKATVRGPQRSDAAYSAWLEAHNPYHVGKAATVSAVLVAGKGYKCNDKYPYKFKLDAAPAGLSYPETTARGISYGKERSVLSVPFVASSPGTHTISGTFSLSVCTETTCKIQKEKLSVAVRVEP